MMYRLSKHPIWWLAVSFATLLGIGASKVALADEPDDAISSVITKLEVQKDAFEKTLSEELSPQRQKIHEAFTSTVGALDDVIRQLQRDPKNAALRAKYEDTMTSALSQAEGLLGDYALLREPTRRKLTGLSGTLQQARQACSEQVETHRNELTRHSRQSQTTEAKLTDLAEKYRVLLTSGSEKLPRDVDLQIRTLEVELAVARQNAQFAELAIQDFESVQADIDAQTEELEDLRTSLEVTFVQAEGQKLLLGQIADLRARRGQAQKLGANVAQMQPLVARATQQNEKVNELIQKFLDQDFRPRNGAVRKPRSMLAQS